jgi:hypothetical protein
MEGMKILRRRTAFLLVIAMPSLTTGLGCGDGKPAIDKSMTEATVSGVVYVKGKPATGGVILFNPSNSGRIVPLRTAPIAPDGTYTIKTLTGGNQVSFDGEVATKNRGVGLIKDFIQVTTGTNEANFDLMGSGTKTGPYDFTKRSGNTKRR